MGALEDKFHTVEEYFSILKKSDEKLEYHNGKIYAMAGGHPKHNLISANVIRIIGNGILEKNCSVYTSDQQVSIEDGKRYVFPDVSVVCGDEEFDEKFGLSLKNPILIVEILSKSTQSYDKFEKFRLYSSIPSFKEYVMVHPDKILVETFYREDKDIWKISNANQRTDLIQLHSIGIKISVAEVYHKIKDIKVEN